MDDSLAHDSDLYWEFVKGKFTVNKTIRKFSAMGEDQAHEQQYNYQRRWRWSGTFWSLTVPYISQMLDNELDQDDQSHREDNVTFERKFVFDCDA